MKVNLKFLVTAVVLSSVLIGCGKRKNDSNVARSGRGNAAVTTNPTTGQPSFTNVPGVTQNFQPSEGVLTGATENGVLSFLSASMDTDLVGQFNPNSDVSMIARIGIANDQIANGQSSIAIIVNDEFSKSGLDGESVDPIIISVTGGSGQILPGAAYTLNFEDDYGVIRIEGNWNNSTAQGRIFFRNKQGPQANAPEQMLGTFSVPVRGFFN